MKLLTILGTGKYSKTCYTLQDKTYESCFVAEVLYKSFNPEEIKVFVTQEAKEANWENFISQFNNYNILVQPISIPSGKSELEMWEIFDAVVSSVEPNSQVIFDITYGFRSIPMLVLLASAFLQKARNVEIRGVYYGAFDVNRERPPIFDLTPALTLLDWLTATNTFLNTGSSVELGNLLATVQKSFYRNDQKKKLKTKPVLLKDFGERVQAISRAIDFVRPVDLIEESTRLQKIPTQQLQEEVGSFAKPFELLLTRIQQDYGQFSLSNLKKNSPREELQKQFSLLQWYVDKKLGHQAILLCREWVISVLCILENIEDYRDESQRKNIEDQLGQMTGETPNLDQKISAYVDDVKKLAKFWSTLIQYRNDIAHTQMKKSPIKAEKLQRFAENNLIQELTELFPVDKLFF